MKPGLLIHSTCQGDAMLHVLERTPTIANNFDLKVIETHVVVTEDWDTKLTPEFFKDVRIIWDMAETGEPQRSRLTLHQRVPAAHQLIRWSSFNILSLWPFAGGDPRLALDPEHSYPWSDWAAASLAEREGTDDQLFEQYMVLTTQRMPNLDRLLARDVARWEALDRIADIENTQFILEHLKKVPLFCTAGHVTAVPLKYLLHQLIDRTNFGLTVDRNAAKREVDAVLRHHVGQDFQTVPIHPVVAERMGLEFYDPSARYRWHCHEWTFREYILKYIKWAPFIR